MDDLPVFVPDVSFSINRGPAGQMIHIKASLLDPQGALREVATEKIIEFLLRDHGPEISLFSIYFEGVYLGPASVLALKQCMHRHTTRRVIFDGGCYGAGFELALCTVFKSSTTTVVIGDRQRLNFTPALADALGNSRSLRSLVIGGYALDESNMNEIMMNESNMKLLALSLCQNQHLQSLWLFRQAFQGDASIVAFASCMHGMTSLRCLRLLGNEFGALGEQELFKVLEEGKTNVNQLLLEGKPDHVQAHIDFLLCLKQKGGQSYIGSCDPNQWIELLVEFKDDMNALYYILRADPGRISN